MVLKKQQTINFAALQQELCFIFSSYVNGSFLEIKWEQFSKLCNVILMNYVASLLSFCAAAPQELSAQELVKVAGTCRGPRVTLKVLLFTKSWLLDCVSIQHLSLFSHREICNSSLESFSRVPCLHPSLLAELHTCALQWPWPASQFSSLLRFWHILQ